MIHIKPNKFTQEQLCDLKQWHEEALSHLTKETIAHTKLIRVEACRRLRTSAGNARTDFRKQEGVVRLNIRLFNTTGSKEEMRNTYLHELAHVIANLAIKKNAGHGVIWKGIFKKMGGNGERCHNMEVSHLRPKRNLEKLYCKCSTFTVTKRRYNRIEKYGATCRSCGADVRTIPYLPTAQLDFK